MRPDVGITNEHGSEICRVPGHKKSSTASELASGRQNRRRIPLARSGRGPLADS